MIDYIYIFIAELLNYYINRFLLFSSLTTTPRLKEILINILSRSLILSQKVDLFLLNLLNLKRIRLLRQLGLYRKTATNHDRIKITTSIINRI